MCDFIVIFLFIFSLLLAPPCSELCKSTFASVMDLQGMLQEDQISVETWKKCTIEVNGSILFFWLVVVFDTSSFAENIPHVPWPPTNLAPIFIRWHVVSEGSMFSL